MDQLRVFIAVAERQHVTRAAEVARDRLVLVVPIDHPLAAGGTIDAAALAATDRVMREPGSCTRQALEAALAAQGVAKPRVVLELPTNEAVCAAVAAGMGRALSRRVSPQRRWRPRFSRRRLPLSPIGPSTWSTMGNDR